MDAVPDLVKVTRDTPELASISLRYGRDYGPRVTIFEGAEDQLEKQNKVKSILSVLI